MGIAGIEIGKDSPYLLSSLDQPHVWIHNPFSLGPFSSLLSQPWTCSFSCLATTSDSAPLISHSLSLAWILGISADLGTVCEWRVEWENVRGRSSTGQHGASFLYILPEMVCANIQHMLTRKEESYALCSIL